LKFETGILKISFMDFGRVNNIAEIDFSLPPDDPLTTELFESLQPVKDPVNIYVGCTEWGRKGWVGKVYPRGAREKDFLAHYAKQFNCVELNALFYNLQPKQVIERWASMAQAASRGSGRVEEFRFCPKFSNTISHIRQLKNAERDTDLYLDHMLSFGSNLGPSFLQLSEAFGPGRAAVLQGYIRQLPRDFSVCVELRHEDWFKGSGGAVADTWQLFRESGIGTVITDTPGRRDCLHMRLTAPVALIRYVGHNMDPTDCRRIDAWVGRIKTWIDKGLKEVYFILHNPEELNSPEMCRYAVEQFNAVCGTNLQPPKLLNEGYGANLSLF
jgi:uncharacterized protein YecE (DUF72 family)